MNTCISADGKFTCGITSNASPHKAYSRDGKFVLKIDERRFCTDALIDFACAGFIDPLHDDANCGPMEGRVFL